MDKGAHFKKCDFQVHTPRDIYWAGQKFGVDTDQVASLTLEQKEDITTNKIQFCKEYLEKARDQGLSAIAITDHHDVSFVKTIRKVANEENALFIANGTPNKCITVFPGIELTLTTPLCQSIIIFDADIPDEHLDTALLMFGIVPTSEYDRNTIPTERISTEHINHLVHLHKKLDDQPLLKGRYILLPNLTKGGSSSLLRSGAQDHYKKMPCVGGYVDKEISTDTGWLNKISGGDVNYGNKSVGIISTSDNRYEDGREFGQYFTWLKWAEPSAEAIRQACLARQSRISQDTPNVPQIYITKIDVTNSKFLGSFAIEFNQQYNALIGGRGTGKSTVLEYLRWGLCDQIIHSSDPDELNELDKRRKKLVQKTLTEFDGEVRITFVLNGVKHVLKRSSETKEAHLKIDNGEFQRVSEEEVRSLLPIQAYSQKQLSSVGVSNEELKRFIQTPITPQLTNLDYELAEIVQATRTEYLNIARKREIEKEIENFNLEVNSLNNQASSLRLSLTGISALEQEVIGKKNIYDLELNIVSGASSELETVKNKITELHNSLETYPTIQEIPSNLENQTLVNGILQAKNDKVNEIKDSLNQVIALFSEENLAGISTLIEQWENRKRIYDISYEEAKSTTTSNQKQLVELQRIEARLQVLNTQITERQTRLREFGTPEVNFDVQRLAYWDLHRRKSQILVEQASHFSTLSKGLIKVEVDKKIDPLLIRSELIRIFSGTRINQDKVQSIIDGVIGNEDPLSEWDMIVDELRQLSELKETEEASPEIIEACQRLTSYGLNENNLKRIGEILQPDNWLNLANLKIEFTPEFKYSTNSEMDDVIAFSEASAGQQATALLTVLLNQGGTPLLIDQPEDDIDNRAIEEIIKNIWDSKKHRQLIFTSHNANLVVNGDAELVICFDYRDAGNQTRGIIKAEGAIDSKVVKDEITSVMEGGEKAFKLRKDKYGY